MPMMRPRKRMLPSFPPSFRLPLRPAALGVLVLAAGLAGCSGDTPLALPIPPRPDVPEVATDSYPTIGTTERTGRPVLTDDQRARLQGDLERLSRSNATSARTAAQNAQPAGN